MNPLSIWMYYRRHRRHAFLLLILSVVVTIGLYSTIALVWGVFVEPARLSYMALSKFSLVMPDYNENDPNPTVIAQIRANPDVAKVLPTTIIPIELPGIMPGLHFQFDLLGLSEKDIPYILERFDATLLEGHLPEPGTNELLLSEDLANLLNVKAGDNYDVISSEFYPGVETSLEATTFVLVGVLRSDIELGIMSLEFLNEHELYGKFPARYLVVAHENRDAALDNFLRSEIQTIQATGNSRTQTKVKTLSMLNERIINEALPAFLLLLPITFIVAFAFSLVIVVINQIANTRRLPEYGFLHAAGLSKSWLTQRLTMETTSLAIVGWVVGIGLSWLVLYLLKVGFFAPQGHHFSYIAWIPIVLSLPIPAAIATTTFIGVKRVLSRLDPVAIVERGELSQEKEWKRIGTASKSSPKPLAPTTFYQRHRQRAVLLISGMSMMILAVILFIFALAVTADAQEALLGYLRKVSIVRLPESASSLDPGIVERVKACPVVERVIPVAPRYHLLSAKIPPFTGVDASPIGVYAEDMAYLIELYGLELKAGRLPRPYTNEIIIPEALAQNRTLEVGDVIGDPDHPAYPGAPLLETEFVVSGIFARTTVQKDGNWLGFASLEFLETYQPFPLPEVLPLIVIPKAGQKDALDNWLENELAGFDVFVSTYHREVSRVQEKGQGDMLGIALLESLIAIAAAIGLAVLNFIFISQRKSEFGVLYALGYNHMNLVGRVLGETAFTIVAAWGFSAIVALIGILSLRFAVFAPLGLTFNLFNITPWLYTLPIPIAVLTVTTGTTARTLSKLDPISIIERR